ncbi:MAG: MerR family DNA-binding transcriptional regulator [Candidatus Helarchaeota archaeon]
MQEAATLLGVTPQTLRSWSNEGYIEAIVGK